jgi:predicted ATPase/DNA-binding CsgD family transcriptional regulator
MEGSTVVNYKLQVPVQNTASLPIYLTRFVGREQEAVTLSSLLVETRMLTLVGAGGIGKTRLALYVAENVSSFFEDGVFWVEAGSLTTPQMLPQAVALLLNVDTSQDKSVATLLLSALQERHLLLVLDTCEHLLPACADFVTELLAACPRLHILATSREPLQATGEMVRRVSTLSLPQSEEPPFDELLSYEAVQLFCERASDIDPRFRLTPENARAVVSICRQLDGLPLALELTAARLAILPVTQLADRLRERFHVLTNGARGVTSRQRTLQATLDWSYALLTSAEQELFSSLAVFAGSWNLQAVEHVCASVMPDGSAIGDMLTRLVNKSLVIVEEQAGAGKGETRYRLQDTMRQYALLQLQQKGTWTQLCEQHYAWYLSLVEEACAHLYSPGQIDRQQRLEAEEADLRIALTRVMEAGDLSAAARMADLLYRFWIILNHFSVGRHWFEALLAADNERSRLSPALRARVLFDAAEFARYQGAYDRAQVHLREQMALLQTLDDPASMAESQSYLGIVLGLQKKYEEAIQLSQTSLAYYRAARHNRGIATTLASLSFLLYMQGNAKQAVVLCEEACQLLRELGDYHHLEYVLFTLTQARLFQGDVEPARQSCQEALQIALKYNELYALVACLGLVGGVAGLEGRPVQAARFFGAARALQERIKIPHPPAGRALLERMVLSVHATLGKEQFLIHFAAGQRSSLKQMIKEAQETLEGTVALTASASAATPLMVALSRREREILTLVAAGLTDIQIAEYVSLSKRTVNKHLQSVYSKLGVNSRTAATRLAIEHGLV